ncbi:unnamed protein product [Bursaphelenchus xylophilus]|uniref:(pine wood nematode) hypothetical protein n=1 Tax=Bursaphelenchus xylophilus TaxID=6326 RepID=A0A1I7RTK6_BURXY|nr:unnamed protein product [Bursaphelenchus xylophilus]CAG9122370.1 unnamed protein product [Bursaphelenchus xylophilus]
MRRKWPPFLDKIEVFTVVFVTLLPCFYCTITSDSNQKCQESCLDKNIAYPLPSNDLEWPESTTTACDFECHVSACNVGCTDLEAVNSTCPTRCASTSSPLSCFQGCLLNQVNVETTLDTTQGVKMNWFFDDSHLIQLQEVSAANLKWFTQSKKANGGWLWTPMGFQAFRDSMLTTTVYLPIEAVANEFKSRLVAIWRDVVVASPEFLQTIPLPPSQEPTLPELISSLQITEDSWAICWHSEKQVAESAEPVKFR